MMSEDSAVSGRCAIERLNERDEPNLSCDARLDGHSTRDHHLLRLGDDPVDMLNLRVAGVLNDPPTRRLEPG